MQQRVYRIQPNTWQGRVGTVIGIALALGLAAALILLSLTLAVVLLPIVAIVLAIGWWRWRKLEAAMREQAGNRDRRPADGSIEIDYRVINDRNRP